jgi:cytochrome P450
MNFMIAGRDTTAQAMSWATLMVARRPDVQTRVAEEAARVLGPAGSPPLTYEALLAGLTYTQAVVSETLRLFPSVPKDGKVVVADDVLPGCGTAVRAGDVVAWSPFCMGRRVDLWGPDASEFKPERFLTGDSRPSPYKYPVFNAGPRTCLGQNMALAEAAYGLALVLRAHVVTLAPDVAAAVDAWEAAAPARARAGFYDAAHASATPLPYQESLTLPIRDGLRCTLAPRL